MAAHVTRMRTAPTMMDRTLVPAKMVLPEMEQFVLVNCTLNASCMFVCLLVCLFACLFVCLFVCFFVSLFVYIIVWLVGWSMDWRVGGLCALPIVAYILRLLF